MVKLMGLLFVVIIVFSMVSSVQALGIERPTSFVRIDRSLQSANNSSDGKAAAGLGVYLHSYYDNDFQNMNNFVGMNLSVIGNTRTGLNYTSYNGTGSIPTWMTENCWAGDLMQSPQNFSNLVNGTRYFFPDGLWGLGGFRFYGSGYVADSSRGLNCSVWISTNGFLSFDLSSSNLTCPASFPSVSQPTAVITPLWTGMTMDASSKIITMWVDNYSSNYLQQTYAYYFVVIWKNMLWNGVQRLTFSVALGLIRPSYENQQGTPSGDVYMAYESVANVGSFAHGIEDMTGKRGVGCLESSGSNWLNSYNGQYLIINQTTDNVYITNVGFQVWDSTAHNGQSSNVAYKFLYPDRVRGYNIRTPPGSQGDTNSPYSITLHQAVGVLSGLGQIGWDSYTIAASPSLELITAGTGVGIIISAGLVIWDLYDIYKQNQYDNVSGMSCQDSYQGFPIDNSSAWVNAPTNGSTIVDASLCTQFELCLQPYDDYTVSHNVTIGGVCHISGLSKRQHPYRDHQHDLQHRLDKQPQFRDRGSDA
jgi:hypothetical protein